MLEIFKEILNGERYLKKGTNSMLECMLSARYITEPETHYDCWKVTPQGMSVYLKLIKKEKKTSACVAASESIAKE